MAITRPLRRDETAAVAESGGTERLVRRRKAFIDAADAVFREKGFAHATLDDVILRSGGSRQTLYALFGNKEGLFKAIVTERSATIYTGMSSEARRDVPAPHALLDLGIRYLAMCVSPDVIGHYQMVIAEGARFPEIAKAYWAAGPQHNIDRLAAYFVEQRDRGLLDVPNPVSAAHHFWGMLQGRIIAQVALGLRAKPSTKEIEDIARDAVRQFLDGCRPKDGSTPIVKQASRKGTARPARRGRPRADKNAPAFTAEKNGR